MMRSIISIGLLSIITIFSYACRETEKSDRSEMNIAKKSQIEKQTVNVMVQSVNVDIFLQELNSNGQLIAREKAVIPFKVQEQIIDLKVNNGSRVKKGQVLAQVESFQYKKTLRDCRDQFEKAR
ncbi:hypothetical protein, partial [Carboxylicivirga sp. N1Y90]|uniref:hypothetical protein n=1 Tax=Carboxylicivirga fragile TaxID=3417571 RepID=UPI003D34F6E1|nr:biotin/lipoyl-binding protein [Marinilabiliaceae bacterium N1Y90]